MHHVEDLEPAERIRQLKAAADAFKTLPWADIGLILRAFGVDVNPREDDWEGDSYSAALNYLERDADATQLAGIHDYVTGRQEEPDGEERWIEEKDSPWTTNAFRLFASHTHANRGYLAQVKGHLSPFGISTFIAHEDIDPSREWETTIEKALASCDALAAFLTPDFHESLWTDQEVGIAFRSGKPILPINIGMQPYGFFGRFQSLYALDIISPPNYGALAVRVTDALLTTDATAAKAALAVAWAFEQADSWATAKALAERLPMIKVWNTEVTARLENALAKNGQVNDAYGVPARVRRLLSSHWSGF